MPKFQAIRPPSLSDINPKFREEWSEFLTDDRSPSLADVNSNTLGEEVSLDKQLENSRKKDIYYNRKKISDAATLLIVVVMYSIPICALILAIILIINGQIDKVIGGFTYLVVFVIGSIASPHLKKLMNITGTKEEPG